MTDHKPEPTEEDFKKATDIFKSLNFINRDDVPIIARALAAERAEAERKIKELETACADFAGRNVTLHCENLELKKKVMAYREVALRYERRAIRAPEAIREHIVDAEAERLMQQTDKETGVSISTEDEKGETK